MTLLDKIKLVTIGRPIVSEYHFLLSEKSFKEIAESMILKEEDLNPFSSTTSKFIGLFNGYYGREFSVKPKNSFLRKDSMGNSIWIHGVIHATSEDSLSLNVTFHRTKFAKYGQWVLAGSLITMLAIGIFYTSKESDFNYLLTIGGFLFSFYLFATLIIVGQASGQIQFFKKHFINDIKKTMPNNG